VCVCVCVVCVCVYVRSSVYCKTFLCVGCYDKKQRERERAIWVTHKIARPFYDIGPKFYAGH
jgi:hypothetical protein